jgi:hypothetical protein
VVVVRARDEVTTAVDELLAATATVRDVATAVPALLGASGERRYLVAMQNSAELRGTGGLVGFHAVLTADAGHLTLSTAEPDEALPNVVATGALDAERTAWLGHTGATASLQTVNLDPDLTRTGPLLVEVYEAATGVSLDGVVVVDPAGLAALLHPDAELEVPAAVAAPDEGLGPRIRAKDLPRTMMVDAYEVLGGDTPARKAFHAALADAAFAELVQLSWDRDLLDRLGFALAGRHLQVHSADRPVQAALERLGVAGRLAPAPGHDLLAVTANNAGGGKPDVHVRHELQGRIVLDPGDGATEIRAGSQVPARRDVVVATGVDNPLTPTSHDDYIIRTSLPGLGRVADLDAHNRTWFTVWTPDDSRVLAGRSGDGPLQASVGTVGGARRVDHLLVTPPGGSARATVELTGPVQLVATEAGLEYRLTVWRQAKGIADDLALRIVAADGWEVVGGAVEGRSDAARLGFDQPSTPLRLQVADGQADVVGTAVGDVTISVTLAPAARG